LIFSLNGRDDFSSIRVDIELGEDVGEDTYVFGVPDNASEGEDGVNPVLAMLSTSLLRCFLTALSSSANAAALYCSFISALASALASASGLLLLRVFGTYT